MESRFSDQKELQVFDKTTDKLNDILKKTKPDQIDSYLATWKDDLVTEGKPFADYMRQVLKKKGLRQQEVFLSADIPEGYGYKLIAEEKHTRRRDIILRLCIAGHFSVAETERALLLNGMSPLYATVPRDAVLIVAINQGIHETHAVDQLLTGHGMDPLAVCGGAGDEE